MSRAEILAAPSASLPESAQFLGGYFHQDWMVGREGWGEVVDDYLAESPAAVVVSCAGELHALLAAGFNDEELRRVLSEVGCSVEPSGFSLTPSGWLAAVVARLDAAT